MSALLQLRNIRKSFGQNLVINDVSLDFPQGSATVIIGASGSGKSTLMRCMNLLEELNDGQINLAGNDNARRCVGDADGRVRRVDVLTACP